eukprot:Ihof_evm20s10 gene=Ihof_evmTU20s10
MTVLNSEDGRRLLVLYGSETGTAEEVAERIVREGKRRHFKTQLSAMDNYDISRLIHEPLVIFVCSTTGQGSNPKNMTKTWRFLLRKSLPADSLCHVKFTVFGLGDSSYTRFNFAAKRLHKRLLQLGAQSVYRRGLGDDQHELGADGELNPWLTGLWLSLLQLYPLAPGMKIIPADVQYLPYTLHSPLSPPRPLLYYSPLYLYLPIHYLYYLFLNYATPDSRYCVTVIQPVDKIPVPETRGLDPFLEGAQPGMYTKEQPMSVRLKENRRMTPQGHWQDVRHIELETNDMLTYGPGDVLNVRPSNLVDNVAYFIDYFQLDPDMVFELTSRDPGAQLPPVPSPCSVADLVRYYLDITRRPSRYYFELLSFFATDEREIERLREFCLPENMDDLYDYCYRMRRTMLEVLADFPSCRGNVPLEYLLDLFPIIQARPYSIACSSKAHMGEVHISVAVVQYKTLMSTPRTGLCTAWLAGLQAGARLDVWVTPGTIKMPLDSSVPMIMIGPGTGVAPFRNFIQERVSQDLAAGMLVFGNRNQSKDYLYGPEWVSYSSRDLLSVVTAFSRDQAQKVYVQHRIKDNGKAMWLLLDQQGAYIYVCGKSKDMPNAVKEALQEVVVTEGGLSVKDGA